MNTSPRSTSGIADALEQAGNQATLAERLGVSQQAISIWLRRGWVPVRRALEIEAQFGVPRARLISPRLADLVDLRESEGGACD